VAVLCTRPDTVRFTMVRNEWARDRRISAKARGLLVYLLSHSDGYRCSQAQIIHDHADGKDAVRSGLGELEATGYLTRTRTRTDGGQWGETDYVLADPFDAAGQLRPTPGRETRPLAAVGEREIHQGGLSAAGNPPRETRPLEEPRENNNHSPTPLPLGLEAEEQRPAAGASSFDRWWAAYPKKVGKDAARRAWAKATKRADADKIIDVTRRYPFRDERQFVKDPATWLNAGCWEDDLEAVAAANGRYGRRSAAPPLRSRDNYTKGVTSF
jgi:hypothetical protein